MDQFTRNSYRGTAKMYTLDPKALTWALHMWVSGSPPEDSCSPPAACLSCCIFRLLAGQATPESWARAVSCGCGAVGS
jgi:hypothetical protein